MGRREGRPIRGNRDRGRRRGGGPEGGLLSPDEEAREKITELLKERLPSVSGISNSKARAIVQTVEQDPSLLDNLNSLYFHIQQLSGRKLNNYHLQRVLIGIYNEVGGAPATQQQQPAVMPQPWVPQQPSAPAPPSGTQQPLQPMGMQPQFGQPVQPGQGQPAQAGPERTYKIVVDGQEIETDEKGLRAWKEYKDEKRERERERESEEETVEVPVGEDETAEVPASQAPLYMQLMQQRSQIEQLRRDQESEDTIKIPTEEGIEEIPASQAPFYMMAENERSRRKAAEKRMDRLQERTENLEKSLREEKSARSSAESPAYSLVSSTKEDFEKKADRLFAMLEQGRLPQPSGPEASGGEGGPKYTPEERREKEEELSEAIQGAEERAKHEEKVIRAAKELSEEY